MISGTLAKGWTGGSGWGIEDDWLGDGTCGTGTWAGFDCLTGITTSGGGGRFVGVDFEVESSVGLWTIPGDSLRPLRSANSSRSNSLIRSSSLVMFAGANSVVMTSRI